MQSGNKVRVGIIGAGGIATQHHLPSLSELDLAELVAICDIRLERAEKLASAHSVPNVYTLYREMLAKEDLDAVFVLVEPDQAYRPAMESLQAGKHVFMEKPPGLTTFQAAWLERGSAEAGRICQVGFNRRHMPIVQHVLKVMREHTTITHVEGRFIKFGEASFYNGASSSYEADMIHSVDLVRHIAGAEPETCSMIEHQHNDVVANSWQAIVRFENQVIGTLRANYQAGGRVHSLELHGPGASAFVDMGFGTSTCSAKLLVNKNGKLEQISLDGMEIAGSEKIHVYYGFKNQDHEFLNCILSGTQPSANICEGLKTMQMLDLLKANRI